MVFHKYEVDGRAIYTELYDDELVTFCGKCNKEMEVTLEDISKIHQIGGDFGGTTFYCEECSAGDAS